MSFPAFTKLGSKFSDPAWLSAGGDEMMFPRLFYNDVHRAVLPSLPASSYSVLYCSDHAATTGLWGRVDFNSIEGTWTDSGAAILSGSNQNETPHPVYDPVGERVLIYSHLNNTNGVSWNDQHTVVYSSTDLANFVLENSNPFNFGNHTGYAQVEYRNGQFEALHGMSAGELWTVGRSYSADGETFTFDHFMFQNPQHVVGSGYNSQAVPFIVQYDDGEWYWITNLATRPRLTSYPAANLSIIAIPIDYDTLRPKGGYYTLVERSVTTTDPDYRIRNEAQLYKIGSDWYLIYSGNTSAGVQHFCVAKAGAGDSTYTAPVYTVRDSGKLSTPTQRTTLVDWDAANDALPATLSAIVAAGSNSSSQVVGSHYEFASGVGSTDLRLQAASAFLPSSYEVIEFTLENLTMLGSVASTAYQFNMFDSATNIDGFVYGGGTAVGGRMRGYINNSAQWDDSAYAYPFQSDVANAELMFQATPVKLTFRLADNGDKFFILVDDQVCYYRDSSTITFGTGIVSQLRLLTASSWMRFSKYTVFGYNPGELVDPDIDAFSVFTANVTGATSLGSTTLSATADAYNWSGIGWQNTRSATKTVSCISTFNMITELHALSGHCTINAGDTAHWRSDDGTERTAEVAAATEISPGIKLIRFTAAPHSSLTRYPVMTGVDEMVGRKFWTPQHSGVVALRQITLAGEFYFLHGNGGWGIAESSSGKPSMIPLTDGTFALMGIAYQPTLQYRIDYYIDTINAALAAYNEVVHEVAFADFTAAPVTAPDETGLVGDMLITTPLIQSTLVEDNLL